LFQVNFSGAQTIVRAEYFINLLRNGKYQNIQSKARKIDSVNYRDLKGRTPLMYASAAGLTKVCKILIDKGASVNIQAEDGSSPLMFATYYGRAETAEFLLEKGA